MNQPPALPPPSPTGPQGSDDDPPEVPLRFMAMSEGVFATFTIHLAGYLLLVFAMFFAATTGLGLAGAGLGMPGAGGEMTADGGGAPPGPGNIGRPPPESGASGQTGGLGRMLSIAMQAAMGIICYGLAMAVFRVASLSSQQAIVSAGVDRPPVGSG